MSSFCDDVRLLLKLCLSVQEVQLYNQFRGRHCVVLLTWIALHWQVFQFD